MSIDGPLLRSAEVIVVGSEPQSETVTKVTLCREREVPYKWRTGERDGCGAQKFHPAVCLAKIRSAFKMNNIGRGRVTCCMDVIQLLLRFWRTTSLLKYYEREAA